MTTPSRGAGNCATDPHRPAPAKRPAPAPPGGAPKAVHGTARDEEREGTRPRRGRAPPRSQ
ncbi:hypothetical protein SAM9427_17825 [Streptomyces sp. ETH9427]|nr:hypothetical protein SAM9427_17825 [Streptomyces sp. ETH9427]